MLCVVLLCFTMSSLWVVGSEVKIAAPAPMCALYSCLFYQRRASLALLDYPRGSGVLGF